MGRSAYHLIHPIMVTGIIVTAAADERILADPSAGAGGATAWLVVAGADRLPPPEPGDGLKRAGIGGVFRP